MARLGNTVRLAPFHIDELPEHPALQSLFDPPEHDASKSNGHTAQSAIRPKLNDFVEEVLEEAISFIDTTVPTTFKSKGSKSSAPSIAKVELLQRMILPRELQKVPWQNPRLPRPLSGQTMKTGEAWFARRSRHANLSVRYP